MRIGLTEKQFNLILKETKKQEFNEADIDSEPRTGASSTQSGGQGYPEINKWESGVTRGPANQVGLTKWADIVGANLKRGKANQLK